MGQSKSKPKLQIIAPEGTVPVKPPIDDIPFTISTINDHTTIIIVTRRHQIGKDAQGE